MIIGVAQAQQFIAPKLARVALLMRNTRGIGMNDA